MSRASLMHGNLRLGTPGQDPETGEPLLLFYGGPFSQWIGPSMLIDGVEYNCAEQYMMAQKARRFSDPGALQLIMATASPSRQKAIGRLVKGFNKYEWEVFARDVVRTASLHKYRHPQYRGPLLATAGLTIVEASPTDLVWGVGLDEDDPAALQRSNWRGSNWLGEVLMEVRSLIKG